MKKIITNFIFGIYVIVAVFVTVCLLSYNENKVTEFGDYSLVIIDNNELSPQYEKGDLVIVDKGKKIEVGENVFFYDTYDQEVHITVAEVTGIEKVTNIESTYTLEGERKVSSEYVLGTADNTTKFAVIGTILSVLESKWGFLFIIVLPALLAFVYQITVIVSEIRKPKEETSEEKGTNNEKK